MATRTDAYPDVAIPPGEYLGEEIEARGISQKELARRIRRPVNAINEIINGKKAITAETALQLELEMPEIPVRFWLNLETDYQLTKALIRRRVSSRVTTPPMLAYVSQTLAVVGCQKWRISHWPAFMPSLHRSRTIDTGSRVDAGGGRSDLARGVVTDCLAS